MAQNDTSVSMTFKNKVTNLDKLKKYEILLKSIKSSADNIPKNVDFGTNSNVNKSNKSIKNFNSSTNSLNKTLRQTSFLMSKAFNVGYAMVFFRAGQRLFSGLQKNIDASSSYVENLNLMQVAFRETGEAYDRFNESFVNGLADAFGLDESAMTRQLGFYRQIGNALNVNSKYADLLSKNLLKMQLDMSSLYNLSFERSGEVIQSSIAGQTKPIRGATGADITQATLQTTLDNLGIDRAISDLSRGEKVLTIYLSLVDQLSESQGDLAKTINSIANQEKIFTEQTARMSRMIGNVFSVTLEKVLPYLNAFLMVVNELVERFAIFIGFKLPTYEQSGGGYDLSDYLDDVADSADKANKAMSGLRSFDKLNVITTPKNANNGVNGLGGIDQRLLNALTDYDLKLSDMENKATKIRDTIMEWLGFTKKINTETGEITWEYDTLGKSSKKIAKEIGTNLANALNKETQKIKWEKYGETLANGVNTSLKFVNSFVYNYDWFALGQGLAKGINTSIENISWYEVGRFFVSKFKIAISTASGFLQKLDYKEIGSSIADFLNGTMENFPTADLAKGIGALGKGIFTALLQVVKEIEWDEVLKQAFIFMGNLGWEGWAILLLPSALKMFTKLFTSVFGTESVLSGITKLVFPDLAKKLNLGGAITDVSTLSTNLGSLAKMGAIAVSVGIIVSCMGKIISDTEQLKSLIDEATGTEMKEKRQQELDVHLNYIDEGVKSGDVYNNFDSYLNALNEKSKQLGINANAVYDQFKGTNAVINGVTGKSEQWRQKMSEINDEYKQANSGIKNIIDNTELNKDQAEQIYQVLKEQKKSLREQKDELTEGSDKWNEVNNLVKDTNGLMKTLEEKYGIVSDQTKLQETLHGNINKEIDDATSKWESFGFSIENAKNGALKGFQSAIEKLGNTNISQGIDDLKENVNNAYKDVENRLKPAFLNLFKEINTKKTLQIDANVTGAENKMTTFFEGISKGLNKFSNVLGFSKITTSFKNIFKFADGGLPPVGQLFVANEKGPELVGQIGGQSFVANQNQMMNLLDSKIGNSKQPINVTIPIQVGDEQIAKVVLNDILNMAEANGKPYVIGG